VLHVTSSGFRLEFNLPVLGVELGFWRQSCDQILAPLEEFSQRLLRKTKGFRDDDDKNRADVVSSSCIACLAHLAILYEVICRTDPVAEETYALCDSALQRLGILTSELHLDEYTCLDILLGVRPSLATSRSWLLKWEAGIGILEEIVTSLRCPYRKSSLGRERVTTALPESRQRKVLRFSNRTSRSRATATVRFGYVGGWHNGGFEVSELDVGRGEGGVWDIIGTLGPRLIANR